MKTSHLAAGMLGFIASLAQARTSSTEFFAYLWIDDVACMSGGEGRAELRLQAQYFDASHKTLPNLPQFVELSTDPTYPWMFEMDRSVCNLLARQIERYQGRLLPVSGVQVKESAMRTVRYPCGTINHRTGDRGVCSKIVPAEATYIQYSLDDLLFTSRKIFD